MLSPYRVLDLSDDRGQLAGYLLAVLGAEIITVETPEGNASRRVGPFLDDEPGLERSLTHFAYNRGKRSVVLDPADPGSSDALRGLIAGADVLIESGRPGQLKTFGLDAQLVSDINPALVHAQITAFGSTGPKADWAATDLTVMASSSTMALTGDADRAPVRLSSPQAFLMGSAAAASGVVLALMERSRSGLGQRVDASAQAAAALATQGGVLAAAVGAPVSTRQSGGLKAGIIELRLVYPCADGYVSITHVFGPAIGPKTALLMEWACEEGFCDEAMRDKDWVGYPVLLESGEEPLEEFERAKAAVEAFTRSKTKLELLEGALKRGLLVAPIADIRDVVESAHLAERGTFAPVRFPAADRDIMAPVGFAHMTASALHQPGPAPALGADTKAVLAEPTRQPAVGRTPGWADDGGRPLSGLKVADFSWSIAGPHSVRILADHGATVLKVESEKKPDGARGFFPLHNNEAGPDNSALFDTMAAGKQSVALNLTKPEARAVARDVVAWADVVIESYSPRGMALFGLDYDELRQINPDIIMVSTSLMGHTGPLANFAGYGNLGAAFAGFYGLAGWPDRPPAGPFGAYTDYTSTHVLALTLLAAIDHHRLTGEGQHIDLAQAEAAITYLAPAVLDYTVNGRIMARAGNRDPDMVPHGVFPASGEDRWVAIACQNDDQWQALAREMARDDLATDLGLASLQGRIERIDELERAVGDWTAGLSEDEIERRLQAKGVAAHVVVNSTEALADPQLAHRGHFLELEHPNRLSLVENCRFLLSRTPAQVATRAPFSGEHTYDVLTETLGYDADRMADLYAAEALE